MTVMVKQLERKPRSPHCLVKFNRHSEEAFWSARTLHSVLPRLFLTCGSFLATWSNAIEPCCGQSLANQEPPAAATNSTDNDSAVEAIERIRKAHNLMGLAGGVIQPDGRIEVFATGIRRIGSEQRLEVNDAMHLGSCTKSMTATLIAMLVDEGKLRWDSTLGELFPGEKELVESKWASVTVDQLMHHTSGIPANAPWQSMQRKGDTLVAKRRSVLRWLAKQTPSKEESATSAADAGDTKTAATRFLYSNVGYVLLGHIVESLRGTSWEDDIQARIFNPLGMKTAGFGAPTQNGKPDSPVGHNVVAGLTVPTENDNPPVMGPAGTVHASLGDWAKYLRAHLECNEPNAATDKVCLSAQSWQHLHTPSVANPPETYAGGWLTGERDWAGKILMHNGSNTHWYCVVFLAPEQRRGFFAASNLGAESAKPCDEVLQWLIRHNRYQRPDERVQKD